MKYILLSIFLVLVLHLNAQEQKGTLRGLLGGAYGFDAGLDDDESALGVNVGLEFFLSNKFSINASYTDYFDEENNLFGAPSTYRLKVINVEGRYYLVEGKIKPYLLLGFAYIRESFDGTAFFASWDEERLGYNGGAGISVGLTEQLSFIYQTKYQVKHIRQTGALPDEFPGQLVLNLGFAYKLLK